MVENSLLSAYKKFEDLGKKFKNYGIEEKLERRLAFYSQEGMFKEYSLAKQTQQEYSRLYNQFRNSFNKFSNDYEVFNWQEYYRNADQLLYGVPEHEDKWPNRTNDILMGKIVEELNKIFPEEHWEYGEVPIYYWEQLNKPLIEHTKADEYRWKKAGAKVDEFGQWIQTSAIIRKCIYKSEVKQQLLDAEFNIRKLGKVCDKLKEERSLYSTGCDYYEDNECSGTNCKYILTEFEEGAEGTFYGVKFTPQEKVINDTIVREIDEHCASKQEIINLNKRINKVDADLETFVTQNGLNVVKAM